MNLTTIFIGLVAGILLALVDQGAIELRLRFGFKRGLALWAFGILGVLATTALNKPWALAVALPVGIVVSGVAYLLRKPRRSRTGYIDHFTEFDDYFD